MTTAPVTLGAVNVEAADPPALAAFWAEVVGGVPEANGDFVFLPAVGPEGFAMFFHPVTRPRPERQVIHLDLTVPWGSRTEVVERVLALGAAYRWDVLEEFEHVQWTTLADPEGNLFCIAEHPPRS
ncbi:VOC family protein [Nocardioides sp.]|uniref:VOC family protein n=1 Tax=Nocardioides sp. TaxID=35761 RepID=UPI002725647F|nr:VOC family protein [Nocardioides sp.]MDO9457624.1 VOC family protein [Nocardioides sp.]